MSKETYMAQRAAEQREELAISTLAAISLVTATTASKKLAGVSK